MKLGFGTYVLGVLGVAALGMAVATAFLSGPSTRLAAQVGVLSAGATGVLGLGLKRWALRRRPALALGSTVVLFFTRLLVWMACLLWLRRGHADVMVFTGAFFAVFVLLLGLEISYVLSASMAGREGVVG